MRVSKSPTKHHRYNPRSFKLNSICTFLNTKILNLALTFLYLVYLNLPFADANARSPRSQQIKTIKSTGNESTIVV